jgi:hypothetical protein
MNVSDIKKRVKRQFGDEAGVQLEDDDIFRWITDAQEEIARQNTGVLEVTALASSVKDQDTYDLPADILTLQTIQYDGRRLKGLSLHQFEEYADGWASPENENLRGIPQIYHVWASKFTVFPKPDTSTTNVLKIWYTKKPTIVTGDGDAISVPSQYHNAIVNFCLAQAYELDENWEASGNSSAKVQSDLNNLKNEEKWTEQISYPTITTRLEDM